MLLIENSFIYTTQFQKLGKSRIIKPSQIKKLWSNIIYLPPKKMHYVSVGLFKTEF